MMPAIPHTVLELKKRSVVRLVGSSVGLQRQAFGNSVGRSFDSSDSQEPAGRWQLAGSSRQPNAAFGGFAIREKTFGGSVSRLVADS